MLSLILESCTERSLIALMEDEQCLHKLDLPPGMLNTQYFIPKIEESFKAAGKNPQDLGYIAVGIGPGSYTGTRVGATVAKSISYSCKIPLIGVCSLEAFVPETEGSFAAVIDAKMGGAYVLQGQVQGGKIIYHSKPEICSLSDFEKKLENIDRLIGPNFQSLQKRVEMQYPSFKRLWIETSPNTFRIHELAQIKYENKKFSLDGTLDILYLR